MEQSNMKVTASGRILLLFLMISLMFSLSPVLAKDNATDHKDALSWPNHGGGIDNRREAAFEKKINKESVKALSLKWTVKTGWDVSDSPSIDVEGGFVYISSWDGCVYAVTKDLGELVWKANLTEIAPTIPGLAEGIYVIPYLRSIAVSYGASVAGLADVLCRSTPTIAGPLLVFGLVGPCYILALNRTSGAVVWWNSLDSHRYCVITQSATYFDGAIYIGTSSQEEAAPADQCCTFQGAFFKLDSKTGQTLWRTPMLPDNHNQTGLFSGVAIWGSSPSIDTTRNLVYVATGNVYSTPPSAEECELARLNSSSPPIPDPCIPDGDYQEAIVAMNLDNGKVFWATILGGYDTWTQVCAISPVPPPNCPAVIGEDYDFGEAPFLFTTKDNRDLVVAAQKSGIVHALDRSTGANVWQTDAGPKEALWGMATDGERVFTSIVNALRQNFTLVPTSTVITWGGFVAINGTTGAILWSTANPEPFSSTAPVAYANGVVFGASDGNVTTNSPSGRMLALDAETGEVLWSYGTEGTIGGGPAIVDGCVYQPVGGTLASLGAQNSYFAHGQSTIALCVP